MRPTVPQLTRWIVHDVTGRPLDGRSLLRVTTDNVHRAPDAPAGTVFTAGALGTGDECYDAMMLFDRLARDRSLEFPVRMHYRRQADALEHALATGSVAPPGPAHVPAPSARDLSAIGRRVAVAKFGRLSGRATSAPPAPAPWQPAARPDPRAWRNVLLAGWYGSETHGDRAILGGVLDFLRRNAPGCELSLTTLYRKISIQTARELDGLAHVRLVPLEDAAAAAEIERADAVIIAGGPLMESAGMLPLARIFAEASRQQKARVIFGCGVGPIHTESSRELVRTVISLATAGFVRDQESFELARELVPDTPLRFACDPALAWLVARAAPAAPEPFLAGLLRANTSEFRPDADVAAANDAAAERLGALVRQLDLPVELLHMNAHWVGGDDRLFNRAVERHAPAVHVARRYQPLDATIDRLRRATASLAMRYHGHLFSLALGVPFLSIDYTGAGGKVDALVRRIGCEQWREPWASLDPARAAGRMRRLIDERAHWSSHLLAQAHRLVAELERTCEEVFGVK